MFKKTKNICLHMLSFVITHLLIVNITFYIYLKNVKRMESVLCVFVYFAST